MPRNQEDSAKPKIYAEITAQNEFAASSNDLPALMDNIYRYERHIFDLTRPLYLVGRDALLKKINPKASDRVLEIGVGTARNLLKLHARAPNALYFGVDVSQLMLEVAAKKIALKAPSIVLKLALEQPNTYLPLFDQKEGFDHVLISFCLTMIPDPLPVLESALKSLKPGGNLWIVDYYDRKGLPPLVDRILGKMMARYHVKYKPAPIEYLANAKGSLKVEPYLYRVSYLLRFTKS